jgi:predicted transport protein
MTPDEFFAGKTLPKQLFEAVHQAVESIGEFSIRVSKSQIAFRRGRNFALVWMPEQYLKRKAAPLVLTIMLRERDTSPRWKEVVEPTPGRFTHHLELYETSDVDEEVKTWLRKAWETAV